MPIIWYTLLRLTLIDLRKISIISVLLYSILIYQYLGLPILYFKLDKFRADDVSNQQLIFQVFCYTSLTITLLIIGFFWGNYFFGKLKVDFSSNLNIEFSNLQTTKLIITTFICFLVFLLYLSKVGLNNLALFSALGLIESKASDILRSAMGNAFEGKYHWYYLFMNRILLFCCYSLYILKTYCNKKHIIAFFYLTVLVTIFSLTAATEKGPLILFSISLFLLYSIIQKKGIIPIGKFVYLSFFLISILIFFYWTFMRVENFDQAFFSIFSRTLTGQIQPAYHYLEFFPNVHDYLYGQSMTNPMGIFPFQSYNVAIEVMAWYSQTQETTGIVGSMPTIFWGELYANFGVIGIVLFSPLVGFLIYAFDKVFSYLPNNILTIALYVWMCMYFFNLSGTGLSSYIFDIYPIFVVFFYFWIMGFNKFYIKRKIT